MEQISYRDDTDGLEVDRVRRETEFEMTAEHFHSWLEFYYLVRGSRMYFIEDRTYLVRAGDLVFINRNVIHKTMPGEEPCHERILLSVPSDFLLSLEGLLGFAPLRPLLSEKFIIFSPRGDAGEELSRLLEKIAGEAAGKQPFCRERIRLRTADLVLFLLRQEPRETLSPLGGPRHQKVYEILRYLSEHAEESCTLEELSGRFYLEKTYLCHIFREVTGLTVREYLNSVRVRNARVLLLETRKSVTEIAQEAGYGSVTHFERVFRRTTGLSPLEYRARQRLLSGEKKN